MKLISKLAIFGTFIALVLAQAVGAGTTPGLKLAMKGNTSGKTVEVTLKLSTTSDRPGQAATVALTNCKFGPQTPLVLAHATRHLDGNNESLMVDKIGQLVWSMTSLPPASAKPRVLRLVFALPQGKGGPYFCVHATALAYATSEQLAVNLKVPLG